MKNYIILAENSIVLGEDYEIIRLNNRYPGYLFHLTKKDTLYSQWAGHILNRKLVLIECDSNVVEDGLLSIYDAKIIATIPYMPIRGSFDEFLDAVVWTKRHKKKIPKPICKLDLIMED
jgi:hypothetical protein